MLRSRSPLRSVPVAAFALWLLSSLACRGPASSEDEAATQVETAPSQETASQETPSPGTPAEEPSAPESTLAVPSPSPPASTAPGEDGPSETAPVSEDPLPPAPEPRTVRLEPAAGARLTVGSLARSEEARASYTLANEGPVPLHWRAQSAAPWLQIEPREGQLAPRATLELALSADHVGAQTVGAGRHVAQLSLAYAWEDEEAERHEERAIVLLVRSSSPLGINLPYVAEFSSQIPFKNLFLSASPWIPQEAVGEVWNTGAELDLDPQGRIRSLERGAAAGVLMARELAGHYQAGPYVLEHEGRGILEAALDASITGARPGRLELAVTPTDAGIHLKLIDTDPSDPLRNLRLAPAAWADDLEQAPFHPDFLRLLEPFSVLRFAAWQRTNSSPLERWGQRTTLEHATQTGPGGVALEHMIALCNELHVDPWFCMPHRANDELVRRFAALVRDRLDPDLEVYVEFSNEVWNPAFLQHAELAREGLEAKLAEDPFEAALARYAVRSLEVFRIWRAAFGSGAQRLHCVLAGQAENPHTGETILGFREAASKADVYAIAPWFGSHLGAPDTAQQVARMSVDQLLDAVAADVVVQLREVALHAELARRYGLTLVAYEGGQHLVGEFGAEDDPALTALFQAANRHPRMGQIYADALHGWRTHGGTLFCPYQLVERPSKWGSWGLCEFQDQNPARAPKYRAVAGFAFENPRWW